VPVLTLRVQTGEGADRSIAVIVPSAALATKAKRGGCTAEARQAAAVRRRRKGSIGNPVGPARPFRVPSVGFVNIASPSPSGKLFQDGTEIRPAGMACDLVWRRGQADLRPISVAVHNYCELARPSGD
jgi:hypothetical protein